MDETTETETTNPITPAMKRQARADLESTLAHKQCPHCASVGCWRVYRTAGKVRFVQCTACGKYDKTAA